MLDNNRIIKKIIKLLANGNNEVNRLTKYNFIDSLVLPHGVTVKQFEGMNRYHFMFLDEGFVVLELNNNYYHLRTKEEYLRSVRVFDYTIDRYHSTNPASINYISYDDTDVFYRLVRFVTHGKRYESDDDDHYSFKGEYTGSSDDGNIAIKCNYCDGGKDDNHIGFAGVCSDRIIRYNIEKEHRVWCSNELCPCFQYYNRKISRNELNNIMTPPSDFVCYESTMLLDWETKAGLTEDGQTTKKFGSTLHKGAVCVFTTRQPDMSEQNRFIFGLFIIDDVFHGNDKESGRVKCNTDYHIELLPDEAKQIRFWNYYRNKNHPEKEQWGTGLFRYISNNAVIGILTDLISLRQGEKKDEVIRFLSEFCRLNNLRIPQNENSVQADDDVRPIVSFSCSGTYDLVVETSVHAHPLKNGFPSKVSPYLMVRATGGSSEALYEVIDTIEINPMNPIEVSQIPSKYDAVKRYISKRKVTFGFKYAPLPYRFYVLRKIHSFNPVYTMLPNPQGHRYLSFEDIGIASKDSIKAKNSIQLSRDNFIESLDLPQGVEAKRYEGMNRVHFKYYGIRFAVIDMKTEGYNLGSRESYMKEIGVSQFKLTSNLGPNVALLKDIPYSDTTVLYNLIEYISGSASDRYRYELQELNNEDQLIEKTIDDKHLVGTDKVSVVKSRVNQGVFRDRLIRKYHKCCLCGVDDESLLIASHIKPWVESSPEERVDDGNGLLLCPNHDRLFDRGYISFDDNGKILISDFLSENNRIFLNVNADCRINLDSSSIKYMKYHREQIYIDRDKNNDVNNDDEPQNESLSVSQHELHALRSARLGSFPAALEGLGVEDINYGDGTIIIVDVKSFRLEVNFDDPSVTKTFAFPSCFVSGRLTLKDQESQIELNEYLKSFKS